MLMLVVLFDFLGMITLLSWKLNLQWMPMVSVFDSSCQISEKPVF